MPDGRDYIVATITFNTKVTESSYLRIRTAILAAYQEAVKMREAGFNLQGVGPAIEAEPDESVAGGDSAIPSNPGGSRAVPHQAPGERQGFPDQVPPGARPIHLNTSCLAHLPEGRKRIAGLERKLCQLKPLDA